MTDRNIIETARAAYSRKGPRAFLSFMRLYRRGYDSEALKREFDELERLAKEQLEEYQCER